MKPNEPTPQLHLKPARAGLLLRDPHTKRALPEEGGHVEDSTFWRRRMAEGDAVEASSSEQPVDRLADDLRQIAHDAAHVAYEGRVLPGREQHEGGERTGMPTGLEPVTPLTTREGGK